ncbi:MAG TPA: DinB family protein [Candidatus Acidoferrales bacterium]|nr:DinB family protein [Candidatus Acidoferrales bacterium]
MKRAQKRKSSERTEKGKRAGVAASLRVAEDRALRQQLVKLLEGGEAHADLRHAFSELPEAQRGAKPAGAPHSAWQLLEHFRIAQWDILEFSRNPRHVSPQFPEGYWPMSEAPPSAEAWDNSIAVVERDLSAMKKLVTNSKTDLFAPIAHGKGQTILREALLLADHNAYHLGQVVLLRRVLGAWIAS